MVKKFKKLAIIPARIGSKESKIRILKAKVENLLFFIQ